MEITKKYNIIILNHHSNDEDIAGDGKHYETSKHLSEQGHNVTVLASSYDNSENMYRVDGKMLKKFNR